MCFCNCSIRHAVISPPLEFVGGQELVWSAKRTRSVTSRVTLCFLVMKSLVDCCHGPFHETGVVLVLMFFKQVSSFELESKEKG